MSAPAFRCPQCDERLRSYGAPRHLDSEAIERTRRCPQCGYKVDTRETIISSQTRGVQSWLKALVDTEG
jgi:transcriptional regulator NrdR family protein